MERKLLEIKEDLEYLNKVWNFRPSLAIIGNQKEQPQIDRIIKMAAEVGIKVQCFESLECRESQKFIAHHTKFSKFLMTREIQNVEEVNPLCFLEDIIREAIGY